MAKVSAPFVRSPYNYDTIAASDESGLFCEDVSLTQQHCKDECDINLILERVARGQSIDGPASTPSSGDFTLSATDYHTMLNNVIAAQESFMALPPKLRERFGNDPANLLAFLGDPENHEEAVDLGLVNAPAKPQTVDLSTGSLAALTGSKASEPVGKSGKKVSIFQRPSKSQGEGEEGED